MYGVDYCGAGWLRTQFGDKISAPKLKIIFACIWHLKKNAKIGCAPENLGIIAFICIYIQRCII